MPGAKQNQLKRLVSASLAHDRGFTLMPKRSGCFIIRQNGMVIDCTASTGKWWDGQQPAAWVMNESGRFDVRIQTAGSNNPIMVSSECRSVMFQVELTEGSGVRDLFTMISRFPDFEGRMAYFSAQVTAPHTLFVFSDRIFTRNWDEAPRRQALVESASEDGFVMRPQLDKVLGTLSTKSLSMTLPQKWDGLLPPSVKLQNGFFEIKVQTASGSPTQAMMVYTRHKEICFEVEMNEGENLPALHAKIAAYPAYGGRKAYFFAKLLNQGELFVSGKQMFARDW
jgi:hypothetical protein